MGVFWNPQDLLLMMGTEIFNFDASLAEKLTKTRVSFLAAPTVVKQRKAPPHWEVSGGEYDPPGTDPLNFVNLFSVHCCVHVCWRNVPTKNVTHKFHRLLLTAPYLHCIDSIVSIMYNNLLYVMLWSELCFVARSKLNIKTVPPRISLLAFLFYCLCSGNN